MYKDKELLYLKEPIRINIYLAVSLIIIKFILIILLSNNLINSYKFIQINKNNTYNYSGYVNTSEKLDNSYYTTLTFSVIRDKNADFIKTDMYMQREGVNYYGIWTIYNNGKLINDHLLNSNEIALSKNIAKRYKIKINDTLTLRTSHTIYELKVKYFFEEYFGRDKIDFTNKLQGLVVLGYNNDILLENVERERLFYSEDTLVYYSDEIEKKDENITVAKEEIKKYILFNFIFMLLLSFTLEILFSRRNFTDYSVLKDDFLNKKIFISYITIDVIYSYSLIYIPLFILSLFFKSKVVILFLIIEYLIVILISLFHRYLRTRWT